MKKKFGLTALGLTLVLGLLASDGIASADPLDDLTAPTAEPTATTAAPAPTTTAAPAPTMTAAPAPAPTEAPTTTAAPAPATESETTRVDGGPSTRRGPDPRWIDYGNCGSGYTACHVAKRHQREGLRQWRQGRWFWWGGDRVRGHRGETWDNFRREARQVRAYAAEARRRRELVARWDGVANCESGGNWSINTGNGYYGGLQFSMGTWRAYGGQGYPHQQPAWYQSQIADRVRVDSGLGHWPHCGRYYG
ncbi:MAG TPA: transglycosylase family protein [Acidimicrobiales bacterium]|nr:transglycosylase family protein [Acidimicrobiales bacterium]